MSPNPYRRGGYLKELLFSDPPRRFFDDKRRKRPVHVKIICYGDYGGIGVHYYVTVTEDHNPIWDSKQNIWTSAWDDYVGEGKKFENKFNTYIAAQNYVRKVTKKFPPKSHRILDWKTQRIFHYREDN